MGLYSGYSPQRTADKPIWAKPCGTAHIDRLLVPYVLKHHSTAHIVYRVTPIWAYTQGTAHSLRLMIPYGLSHNGRTHIDRLLVPYVLKHHSTAHIVYRVTPI